MKAKKKICYSIGAVLAVMALFFLFYGIYLDYDWTQKSDQAGAYSDNALSELFSMIEHETLPIQSDNLSETEKIEETVNQENKEEDNKTESLEQNPETEEEDTTEELITVIPEEMPYRVIDEIKYLGILEIPDLALTLPVILLDEWIPEMMDYAPCTYSGSLKTADLVIMAHNYESHFRPILTMQPGQTVKLTTADGLIYTYTVTAVDVMNRRQKEKLYEGEWDMTLFTCVPQTYNRCAVRCNLICVSP